MAPAQGPVEALRKQLDEVEPRTVAVADLAAALIKFTEARGAQLDLMDQRLDTRRDLPWKHGMALLSEATSTANEPERRLASAADEFEKAHSHYEQEPAYSFWPALTAATINGKLGRMEKATHLAAQSYKEAVEAVQGECLAANALSARRRKIVKRTVSGLGLLAGGLLAGGVGAIAKESSAAPLIGWILPFGVLISIGVLLLWMGLFSEAFVESRLEHRLNPRLLNAYELACTVGDIRQIAIRLGVERSALPRYELRRGHVEPTGDFDYTLKYLPRADSVLDA